MIPTPFRFLEVFMELFQTDAALPGKAGLGVAPEGFDAVDVPAAPGELVLRMMDPVMAEAVEHQPVISLPGVGMDDGRSLM